MPQILLNCNGFHVSGCNVPPFTIQRGSLYQINMPFVMRSAQDMELLSILTGKKINPHVEFYSTYPTYTSQLIRERKGLLGVFRSNKVISRLSSFYGIKKEDIESKLLLHRIKGDMSWNSLSLVEKCTVSFEVATIRNTLLFFDTAGLDPLGIEKMFSLAKMKCKEDYSVICLCYPIWSKNYSYRKSYGQKNIWVEKAVVDRKN